jgi:cephalosporin hydroxylase
MKLIIDTEEKTIAIEAQDKKRVLGLYTKEAFEFISEQWLKVGWDQKYSYTFSWMGRPIMQLPEDMIRAQEVIYKVKPDVIIETGIAHGGSLIYYASICKAIGKGRVIGIDIEIRPHNRKAIESHELFSLINIIEGNSTALDVIKKVKSSIKPGEVVMLILDSCHAKQHVLAELEAYHDLITPGSYIAVADGIMQELYDVPHGIPELTWNNPASAVTEFAQMHPKFVLEQPAWPFNESELGRNVTYWAGAWLRRKV